MKKTFVDMIECPTCRQPLTLSIVKEVNERVVEGKFTCAKCNQEFPIENSIPNFLPPELR